MLYYAGPLIIIIIIIALQHSEDLDMVSDEQKLVLNEVVVLC